MTASRLLVIFILAAWVFVILNWKTLATISFGVAIACSITLLVRVEIERYFKERRRKRIAKL